MIFRGKSGYGDATFMQKLLFSWIRPLISRANKIEKEKSEENILLEELGEPALEDKFDVEVAAFNANYKRFENKSDALFFASIWTFKYNIIIDALLNMFINFVYYSVYS